MLVLRCHSEEGTPCRPRQAVDEHSGHPGTEWSDSAVYEGVALRGHQEDMISLLAQPRVEQETELLLSISGRSTSLL